MVGLRYPHRAVNVSFYDCHVEQVKLERLWHLTWHRDYIPGPRRQQTKNWLGE